MRRVLRDEVAVLLAALERLASPKFGLDLATRYGIVTRESSALKAAALKSAQRLAASTDAGARWAGKDALRALSRSRVSS